MSALLRNDSASPLYDQHASDTDSGGVFLPGGSSRASTPDGESEGQHALLHQNLLQGPDSNHGRQMQVYDPEQALAQLEAYQAQQPPQPPPHQQRYHRYPPPTVPDPPTEPDAMYRPRTHDVAPRVSGGAGPRLESYRTRVRVSRRYSENAIESDTPSPSQSGSNVSESTVTSAFHIPGRPSSPRDAWRMHHRQRSRRNRSYTAPAVGMTSSEGGYDDVTTTSPSLTYASSSSSSFELRAHQSAYHAGPSNTAAPGHNYFYAPYPPYHQQPTAYPPAPRQIPNYYSAEPRFADPRHGAGFSFTPSSDSRASSTISDSVISDQSSAGIHLPHTRTRQYYSYLPSRRPRLRSPSPRSPYRRRSFHRTRSPPSARESASSTLALSSGLPGINHGVNLPAAPSLSSAQSFSSIVAHRSFALSSSSETVSTGTVLGPPSRPSSVIHYGYNTRMPQAGRRAFGPTRSSSPSSRSALSLGSFATTDYSRHSFHELQTAPVVTHQRPSTPPTLGLDGPRGVGLGIALLPTGAPGPAPARLTYPGSQPAPPTPNITPPKLLHQQMKELPQPQSQSHPQLQSQSQSHFTVHKSQTSHPSAQPQPPLLDPLENLNLHSPVTAAAPPGPHPHSHAHSHPHPHHHLAYPPASFSPQTTEAPSYYTFAPSAAASTYEPPPNFVAHRRPPPVNPLHPRAQQAGLNVELRHNQARLANNESRADSFVTAAEDFSSSDEDHLHRQFSDDGAIGPEPATPEDPESMRFAVAAPTPSELTIRRLSFGSSSTASDSASGSLTPRTQQAFTEFDGSYSLADDSHFEASNDESLDDRATETDTQASTHYDTELDIDNEPETETETETETDTETGTELDTDEGETELEVEIEWNAILGSHPAISALPIDRLLMIETGPPEGVNYSTTNTTAATSPVQPTLSPADSEESRVTIRRVLSPFEDLDFNSNDIATQRVASSDGGESDDTQKDSAEMRLRIAGSPFARRRPQSHKADSASASTPLPRAPALDRRARRTPPVSGSPSSAPYMNPLAQHPPSPVLGALYWASENSSAGASRTTDIKRHSINSLHSTASTTADTVLLEHAMPRRQHTLRHVRRNLTGRNSSSSDGSQSPEASVRSLRESGVALLGNSAPAEPKSPASQRTVAPHNHTVTSLASVSSSATAVRASTPQRQGRFERQQASPLQSRYAPRISGQMLQQVRPDSQPKLKRTDANVRIQAQMQTAVFPAVDSQSRPVTSESPHRQGSVYSSVSVNSMSSNRARKDVWKNGGIPVVVIPGRSTSVGKSKDPTARPSSGHRGHRPQSASSDMRGIPAYPVDAETLDFKTSQEAFRTELSRHSRSMSESNGSDVRTADYPPEVPKRSSSLSAPTSRNTSRAPSVNRQAQGDLHSQLAQHEQRQQVAVRIEPPAYLHPSISGLGTGAELSALIPGFAPAVSPNRLTFIAPPRTPMTPEEEARRREVMLKTPFSVASIETTGTTLEMSEAKAVSIFPHQNSSVLVVDHTSSRPSDSSTLNHSRRGSQDRLSSGRNSHHARDELSAGYASQDQLDEQPVERGRGRGRGRSRTPASATEAPTADNVEPSTPICASGERMALEEVDSPLRNPRDAPTPPTATAASTAQPTDQRPQTSESAARRSLSLVRRALSRRRASVMSTTSQESSSSNFIARAFSTAVRRDRKYPPAAGGRDVTSIPGVYPGTSAIPRSNSDPSSIQGPRAHTHSWRRPTSSTSNFDSGIASPDRSQSQLGQEKPPSRASSLKRSISDRLRLTLMLSPSQHAAAGSTPSVIAPATSNPESVQRRVIARSTSGTLRVVNHSATSSESLRQAYISSEASRPHTSAAADAPAMSRTDSGADAGTGTGRSKTAQSQRNSLVWVSSAQAGVRNSLTSLGAMTRRISEKRRVKRTQELRSMISAPTEVRDGVDDVVRRREPAVAAAVVAQQPAVRKTRGGPAAVYV
ncbi:hypothetical protein BROUX41_005795 [Berkeleyomyces rouxiae]|uniref:uncharacterized protein n=1 Tax=Berkeleyomyces rouxiae TaxID=2035830 RepID=UPI003B7645F6